VAERIVITGVGAVCGAGLSVDAVLAMAQGGKTAVGPISHWDASSWPVQVAGEVRGIDHRTLVDDRKLHKIISRTDLLGLYAADRAIQQSGLAAYRAELEPGAATAFNERTGVLAGSGGGAYRSNYDYFPLLTEAGGDLRKFGSELAAMVNPMWLLKNLPNNVVCHVGIRHGFKGTNACITNQCVGGIMAVVEGAASLRYGEADRVVAVGHDAPIEPETVLHYHRLGLLASDLIRPFDRRRSGTVFGEGAAALVLEQAGQAEARGATVLGEVLGSGCVSEATGMLDVRPNGDGLARAMTLALGEAGLEPNAVGMIVAHGNGTRASDASEAQAIRSVFGPAPPPVTGFKWAFGHLIAASGILDLTLALAALRLRVAPGIATLTEVDPELAPLPVSAHPREAQGDVALVCCRGFGGMNVVVAVRVQR
jgi:3-oxoacyl-[acyl-carrier-protein] synthase-1